MVFQLHDGEPDILLLPYVPVSLLVEVCEAHVVGVDLARLLPLLLDFPAYVVLRLHAVLAGFVPAFESILLVCKRDFSRLLMAHIAHENVEDIISCIVKSNPLAILKDNFFEALGNQVCRLHAHLNAMLRPSLQYIVHIRAFDQKV